MNISIKQFKVLLIALGVLLAFGLTAAELLQPAKLENLSPVETSPGASASESFSAELVVDVQGRVWNPGVYALPAGSRVIDAIKAAGGLRGIRRAGINQARYVVDGELIQVGSKAEQSADGRINLNSATAAELESLPGIGPVLAERIVLDREQNGRFAEISELDRVSGVGEHILQSIAELVVCE